MLATSIGGKLRGEETGARAIGTSSVVSKAPTRGDIGVPTNELCAESGTLSPARRGLAAALATSVDELTADSRGAGGRGISPVSGTACDVGGEAAVSPAADAPGTGCVAGAASSVAA